MIPRERDDGRLGGGRLGGGPLGGSRMTVGHLGGTDRNKCDTLGRLGGTRFVRSIWSTALPAL